MNPVLRSAARSILRSAARRAVEAQRRLSERDRAIALIDRKVRAQLRARGAAVQQAPQDTNFLATYTGAMVGVVLALVWRQFNPPEKTYLERWLEANALQQGLEQLNKD